MRAKCFTLNEVKIALNSLHATSVSVVIGQLEHVCCLGVFQQAIKIFLEIVTGNEGEKEKIVVGGVVSVKFS